MNIEVLLEALKKITAQRDFEQQSTIATVYFKQYKIMNGIKPFTTFVKQQLKNIILTFPRSTIFKTSVRLDGSRVNAISGKTPAN